MNKTEKAVNSDIPLVSVVVPVYNVESFLEQCVRSIVEQTYEALEILLVDDGSTDSSGLLCDKFSAQFDRVICLHKTNGGLADARNYGTLRCKGDYVAFIDSDDVVSPVFIESLMNAMVETDCDMAAFGRVKTFNDGSSVRLCRSINEIRAQGPFNIISAKEYIERILYNRSDTGAYCRLYRRNLVLKYPFPTGMIFEDAAVVYRMVHDCESIALLPSNDVYGYRIRSGSIMHSGATEDMVRSAISIGRQVSSDINAWYPESAAAASCGFSINRVVLLRTDRDDKWYRELLWREMLRYRRDLLLDKKAKPKKRLAAALTICGRFCFVTISRLLDRLNDSIRRGLKP